MRDELREATLIFDKVGGHDISNKLRKNLKEGFNDESTRRIKRFEGHRSASQCLQLQVADMICGSIARKYGDDSDDTYYRIIKKRVAWVKEWPD